MGCECELSANLGLEARVYSPMNDGAALSNTTSRSGDTAAFLAVGRWWWLLVVGSSGGGGWWLVVVVVVVVVVVLWRRCWWCWRCWITTWMLAARYMAPRDQRSVHC